MFTRILYVIMLSILCIATLTSCASTHQTLGTTLLATGTSMCGVAGVQSVYTEINGRHFRDNKAEIHQMTGVTCAVGAVVSGMGVLFLVSDENREDPEDLKVQMEVKRLEACDDRCRMGPNRLYKRCLEVCWGDPKIH